MRSDFKFYIIVFLFVISIAANFFFSVWQQSNETQSAASSNALFIGKGLEFSRNFGDERKDGILRLDIQGMISFQDSGRFGSAYTRPRVASWISVLDKASKDSKIKGLLLRIDSGGGAVVASQELYEAVKRFRETGKNVVVSVGEVCASGAYMVSLPADVIVVNEGSIVGSIGVLMQTGDASELLKKIGVKASTIKSVKYKDILSPLRATSEEEKRILQDLVKQVHQIFVNSVVKWRAKHSSEKNIRSLANGLFWVGEEAKRRGLVDKIGDEKFAEKEIAVLVGLDHETMKVYGVNDYLFGSFFDQLTFLSLSLVDNWVREGLFSESISEAFNKMFLSEPKKSISY